MCGCQLSLYGNIGLAPDNEEAPADVFSYALTNFSNNAAIQPLSAHENDWTRYRGRDDRSDLTGVTLPEKVSLKWEAKVSSSEDLVTAPVAAGGLVFTADRNGVVQAHDAEGNKVWQNFAEGAVFYPPVISKDRLFLGAADGKVYAFEAKTGRLLWTFRTGPKHQLIPVFGKLVSSWPVSGGVVVDEKSNRVYAAAGITHYDGTMVVALDASTGELKAKNIGSGVLSSEVNSGISMQGNLKIVDGELQFLGGGVYETARYDLENLSSLNESRVQINAQYRTAFYPYYPEYGKYVSLSYTCEDGCVLNHDANYEGLYFTNLALQEKGESGGVKDKAGEFIRMQKNRRKNSPPQPKNLWQDNKDRRFTSFIVSEKGDTLLAAGHPDEKPEEAFLVSINIHTGEDQWIEKLPSVPVKGGTAIDSSGRIFVTMENGEIRCYAAE